MSCYGNGKLVTFELVDHRLITLDLDCEEDWGDISTYIEFDTNKPVIQIGNDEDGYVKVLRCFEELDNSKPNDYVESMWQTFGVIDNLKVIEYVLIRLLCFCDGYTMNDLESALKYYGIDINKVDIPKDWINE